jgi:hypothetical protein
MIARAVISIQNPESPRRRLLVWTIDTKTPETTANRRARSKLAKNEAARNTTAVDTTNTISDRRLTGVKSERIVNS